MFKTKEAYDSMYKQFFSPILSRFNVPEEEKLYIMNFYMKGIISIIMTWVNDNCELEIEKVLKLIKSCINF